jgi:hypothetical protein
LCIVFNWQAFSNTIGDVEVKVKEESGGSAKPPTKMLSQLVERGIKYLECKGFDIILPDLNVSKLPQRNLQFDRNEATDLPAMTVIYHVIACSITIRTFTY